MIYKINALFFPRSGCTQLIIYTPLLIFSTPVALIVRQIRDPVSIHGKMKRLITNPCSPEIEIQVERLEKREEPLVLINGWGIIIHVLCVRIIV